MGHRNGQEAEMAKAMWFYRPIEEPTHIINETPEQHKNLRRQMAHGFSEKGDERSRIVDRKYVNLLVEKTTWAE